MIKLSAIIILLLLVLKNFEMGFQSYRIMRCSKTSDVESVAKDWPVTRMITIIRIESIFRLPLLLTLSLILIIYGRLTGWLLIMYELTILCAIWTSLFQALISRLTFGYSDIYFRRMSVNGVQAKYDTKIDRQHLIKEFVIFIVGFIYVITIGYAAIYSALFQIDEKAFTGALGGFVNCFYFSVVTFATVGYGDIAPFTEVARILTISEIFVGLGALVLLVLAYSITAQETSEG